MGKIDGRDTQTVGLSVTIQRWRPIGPTSADLCSAHIFWRFVWKGYFKLETSGQKNQQTNMYIYIYSYIYIYMYMYMCVFSPVSMLWVAPCCSISVQPRWTFTSLNAQMRQGVTKHRRPSCPSGSLSDSSGALEGATCYQPRDLYHRHWTESNLNGCCRRQIHG